ncbi:MAG: A/G-specific adenine glycosylase, partial [Schleiferiaceae bacterium]
MSKNAFNHFIISIEEFFNQNKRDLPWRKKTPVAYEVWLSEIILQQTRVAQGTPYFKKILAAYPTIKALAEAPEDELLALWTGLGYYSRARNLQKGAQQIMAEFQGQLPSTSKDLLSIKGIGPYTAAAIASICFGERKGVVD